MATVTGFADVAFSRAIKAMDAYHELGDRWDTSEPSVIEASEIAVDAAMALEASLKAILDDLKVPRRTHGKSLFDGVAALPTTSGRVRALKASIDLVVDTRNTYLHADMPATSPRRILAATRDALRALLILAAEYPVLRSRWTDVADALWRFDDQPAHFANQARTEFSNRTIADLRCGCLVALRAGEGWFTINGALQGHAKIGQGKWDWSGEVGPWFDTVSGVRVAIGAFDPPESVDGTPTANGSGEQLGALSLIAHELPVLVDSFGQNPLAAPLYVAPGSTTAMPGPGSLEFRRLKLSIPYKLASQWFVTPDRRQEIVSEFLDSEVVGSAEGELMFYYPGHVGGPAFRGAAHVHGSVSACRAGSRIAERDWVGYDATTNVLKGWRWKGELELRFRCDLQLTFVFGEVEVFDP